MSNDSKLIELSCKEYLMGIVKESKILDEKLSFFQKTLLYDKISEMDYSTVISVLFNDGKEITSEQKREFESKTKKAAKYGAAATLGGYGIRKASQRAKSYKAGYDLLKKDKVVNKAGKVVNKAARPSMNAVRGAAKYLRKSGAVSKPARWKSALAAVAGLYLYRKLSDPCVRKNIGNKKAQIKCRAEAIKKVIDQIKNDMGKCVNASNPEKCKAKLTKELVKWQTKYQKLVVEYTKGKKQ